MDGPISGEVKGEPPQTAEGMIEGRPGDRCHPPEHGCEDSDDGGRTEGCQGAERRGRQDQRDSHLSPPTQALLAARAGATYVSPFLGTAGRHQRARRGPDPGDRGDLRRGRH